MVAVAMLMESMGTLFIPSLDRRNHLQERLELKGRGGAVVE